MVTKKIKKYVDCFSVSALALFFLLWLVTFFGCAHKPKCNMICNADEVLLCSPDCEICPVECDEENRPLPDEVIRTKK